MADHFCVYNSIDHFVPVITNIRLLFVTTMFLSSRYAKHRDKRSNINVRIYSYLNVWKSMSFDILLFFQYRKKKNVFNIDKISYISIENSKIK